MERNSNTRGTRPWRPSIKKTSRLIACSLIVLTLSSCLFIEESLYINRDGSGKIVLECQSDMQDRELMQYARYAGISDVYPPFSEVLLKQLFPEEDFTVTIDKPGEKKFLYGVRAEISFPDIDTLLKSTYGKAKSMELAEHNGKLRFRARTGVEMPAIMAAGEHVEEDESMSYMVNALLDDRDRFSARFAVYLPDASSLETHRETDSNSSNSVEKNLDFASMGKEKFLKETHKIMELTCPLGTVAFESKSPGRMPLDSFADLPEEMVSQDSQLFDPEDLRQMVRFNPTSLSLKRAFLLGTCNGGTSNEAVLSGELVVSTDPLPSSLNGHARITKAVDDLGTNLSVNRDSRRYSYGREEKLPPGRFKIDLAFQPPTWGAEKLEQVAGEADLQFISGYRIKKITSAIKAEHIEDSASHKERSRSFYNDSQTLLDEGDFIIKLESGVQDRAMLTLELSIVSESNQVLGMEIYDAHGKPWPAFKAIAKSPWGDRQSWRAEIALPGKPALPLSMAIMTNAAGQSITVPFEARDIPCVAKPVEKHEETTEQS